MKSCKTIGASEYLVENTRQGAPEDLPPSQLEKTTRKLCHGKKKREMRKESTKTLYSQRCAWSQLHKCHANHKEILRELISYLFETNCA